MFIKGQTPGLNKNGHPSVPVIFSYAITSKNPNSAMLCFSLMLHVSSIVCTRPLLLLTMSNLVDIIRNFVSNGSGVKQLEFRFFFFFCKSTLLMKAHSVFPAFYFVKYFYRIAFRIHQIRK